MARCLCAKHVVHSLNGRHFFRPSSYGYSQPPIKTVALATGVLPLSLLPIAAGSLHEPPHSLRASPHSLRESPHRLPCRPERSVLLLANVVAALSVHSLTQCSTDQGLHKFRNRLKTKTTQVNKQLECTTLLSKGFSHIVSPAIVSAPKGSSSQKRGRVWKCTQSTVDNRQVAAQVDSLNDKQNHSPRKVDCEGTSRKPLPKPYLQMNDQLMSYVVRHNNEEEIFARLREETGKLPGAGASMQVSPEQGNFLAFLIRICGVKRAIEVGVYTGYSSLSMAQALPSDGQLVACEIDDRWLKIASRYWEEAGVRRKIDARLGPALETLEGMLAAGEADKYDLAFVDADKRSYLAYFEGLLKLIRPGGLIVVDNVLWHGKVADLKVTDKKTEALRQFNDFVARDPRVSTVMLPIGDGMTLCQRKT